MKLRKVAGGCDDGTCPAIYVTDRGTAVIQGDAVLSAEGLQLGLGEGAVELPAELVLTAMAVLSDSLRSAPWPTSGTGRL